MANTIYMSEAQASIARESFVEAQDKARAWADRSIELTHSGDIEQANHAQRYATAWLSRMLDIERRTIAEPPLPARAKRPARKAEWKSRRDNVFEVTGNNATLRAWRRSCLLPDTPESG